MFNTMNRLSYYGILRKFLMNQYRNYKHEDFGYMAAFLSRSRVKLTEQLESKSNILTEGYFFINKN